MGDRRSPSSGRSEDNDSFFEQWKAKQLHKKRREARQQNNFREFLISSNNSKNNSAKDSSSYHYRSADPQNNSNDRTTETQNHIENRFNNNTSSRTGRDEQMINLLFHRRTFREWLILFKTYLISFLIHLLLIIPLLFIVATGVADKTVEIISQPGDEAISPPLTETFENESVELKTESEPNVGMDPITVAKSVDDSIERPSIMDSKITDPSLPMNQFEINPIQSSALIGMAQGQMGSAFQGRGENKNAMLAAGGGSQGSEKAVADALSWLAEHQLHDGSWSFNLNECPQCNGKCTHSGRMGSAKLGATAIALLPFISAGITPYQGKYRNNVKKGIEYLLKNAVREKKFCCFADSGGTMYSHGLTAILLCETYGMLSTEQKSRWPALKNAAIGAIDYIVYAQDPNGGGWRYFPKDPGDTSVVGWQMMALKSMQLSKLTTLDKNVYPKTLFFLSKVTGSTDGSEYGYTNQNGATLATSSVGLLCRLYLGWKPTTPALLHGADKLLKVGPQFNDPYYVYYATQLFHHIGADRWKNWNHSVRDPLIEQQSHAGHEAGSWFPENANSHCLTGGRLYVTALNCMTLQIYYRYLPLYRESITEKAPFPLN